MYSINGNYIKKNYLRENYGDIDTSEYTMTDEERAKLQQTAKDQGGYTSNVETITEKTGSLDISIDKVENVDIIDERTSYFKEHEIIDIENVTEVTQEIEKERSYSLEESVYKYQGKSKSDSCCDSEKVFDGYNLVTEKESQYNFEFNGCPVPKDPSDDKWKEVNGGGSSSSFTKCKAACDANEECDTFEISGCSGNDNDNPTCNGECILYQSGEDGIKSKSGNDANCKRDGSVKTYKRGPSVKKVITRGDQKSESTKEVTKVYLEPAVVDSVNDNPEVELYEACDFDDKNYKKHIFGPGEYRDIKELGMRTGGYGVSSIRISSGAGLYVYSQPNFKGSTWGPILGPVNLPCLVHHGWNDRIHSFIITRERGKVQLFQHCGYNGYKVEYGVGEYPDIANDLSMGTRGARRNDLSSVRVGKDLNLIIYDGRMFTGAHKIIEGPSDISCFVHMGWNDRVESIRVQPKEMKKAFDKKNDYWIDLVNKSPNKIIRRICQDCRPNHQYSYWKPINKNWKKIKHHGITTNLKDLFLNTWFSQNNKLNQDFRLYSDYKSAIEDKNRWNYCNYDDPGIGFPRDCGPNGYVPFQWNSKGDKTRGYPWNTYGASRIQYAVEDEGSTKDKPKWKVLYEDPYFIPVDTNTGGQGCTFGNLTTPVVKKANIVIDNFGELYINGKFMYEISGANGDLSVIPQYPELNSDFKYGPKDGSYKKIQIVVKAMDAGGPGMFAGWFQLDKKTRIKKEKDDGTVEMTPTDEFWTNKQEWKCYRVKDDVKIEEAFSEAYTLGVKYSLGDNKYLTQGRFEREENQKWSTEHGDVKSSDGDTLNKKFETLFPDEDKSNFHTLKLHEYKNISNVLSFTASNILENNNNYGPEGLRSSDLSTYYGNIWIAGKARTGIYNRGVAQNNRLGNNREKGEYVRVDFGIPFKMTQFEVFGQGHIGAHHNPKNLTIYASNEAYETNNNVDLKEVFAKKDINGNLIFESDGNNKILITNQGKYRYYYFVFGDVKVISTRPHDAFAVKVRHLRFYDHQGKVYSQPIIGFITKDKINNDEEGGTFYRGVMCFKDVNVQSFWYYPEDQLIVWEGLYSDVPDKRRVTTSHLKWYGKVPIDKVIKDDNLVNLGEFGSGVDINKGVKYPGGGGAWNSNWNVGKTKDKKCMRIWQDCEKGQCGNTIGQGGTKYKDNKHRINDDYKWWYFVLEIPAEESDDCQQLNRVTISPTEVKARLTRRSLTAKDLPGQSLWKYVKDRRKDENRFTWSGRIYNCMKGGENCGDELTDEGGSRHNAITYINDEDGVGIFNKVLTPNKYEYKQLGGLINNLSEIVFEVTAKNDAHIALGETTKHNGKHYEIVIGGWGNSLSVIRSSNQGRNLVKHGEKILKRDMINGLKWDYYRVLKRDGTFESKPFKSTVIDEPVHYWWNTNNVLDSGIKDYIGFHITGYFNVEKSGKYKFRVRTDDGFKMSIGGQSVISSYRLQAPTYRYSSWVELEADKYYDLDIRWYEWGGHADMELEWHNEQETAFYKIPKKRFWSLSQQPAPQSFWVSWKDNFLKIGKGNKVGDSEFMKLDTSPYNYSIQYMLVSTGWGSEGSWKLKSSTGRTDVITKQTADLLCNSVCYWYGKQGSGSARKNFIDANMCDCTNEKTDDPFGCNEKDEKCAKAINFNAEPVNCSIKQALKINEAWPGDKSGNGKIELLDDNLKSMKVTYLNKSINHDPNKQSPKWTQRHRDKLYDTIKQIYREEQELLLNTIGRGSTDSPNQNIKIDYDNIESDNRFSTIILNMSGSRPKAIGAISNIEQELKDKDGKVSYFNTGALYFTDDRIYKFWYHNREAIIYWDNNQGTHLWRGQLGTAELPEGCLPQYQYNKMYKLTRNVEFQKNLKEEIDNETGNVKMSKISSVNVSFKDDTNLLEVDFLDPKVKELIKDAFPDYYTSNELSKNKQEADKKLKEEGGELSKDKVSSSLSKNAIGEEQLTGSAYYCSFNKEGKNTFMKGIKSVSSAIGYVKGKKINENFDNLKDYKYTIDGMLINNGKIIETLETYLTSRINDNQFKKVNSSNVTIQSASGTKQTLPNEVSDDVILEVKNTSNVNKASTNVTKVFDLVSSGESLKLSLYAKGKGEMEIFIYNGTEGNLFGQTKLELENEWKKYELQYPFTNTSEGFISISVNTPLSTIFVTGITVNKFENQVTDTSNLYSYKEDETLINCKLIDPYPENLPTHNPDNKFTDFVKEVKTFCNNNDKCSGFLLIPPEKQKERNKVFQVDTNRSSEKEEPIKFVKEEPPSCGTAGVIPTGAVIKNVHETNPDIGACGCQNKCNEDPTCKAWYYYKEDGKNFCKFTNGTQLDVVNKNYYGSLSLQKPNMNDLNYGNTREIVSGRDATGSVTSELGNKETEVEKSEEGGGISLIIIIFLVCFVLVYLVISKMY